MVSLLLNDGFFYFFYLPAIVRKYFCFEKGDGLVGKDYLLVVDLHLLGDLGDDAWRQLPLKDIRQLIPIKTKMNQCVRQLLPIRLVAAIVLKHYVVAECTISVVLALAIEVGALMILIELIIPLPLRHLPDLQPVLVPLIRQSLDLSIVEVLDPQQLHPRFNILLANHVDLLEQLLIFNEFLVEFLIVAYHGAENRRRYVHIPWQ